MPLIAAISTVSGGVVGLGVEGVQPVDVGVHPVAAGNESNAAQQPPAQGPLGQGQV